MLRYISGPISRRDVLFKWMSVVTWVKNCRLELTILKTQIAYLRVLNFFPRQEAKCCEAKFQKRCKVTRRIYDIPETLVRVSLASYCDTMVNSPVVHTDENNWLAHSNGVGNDNPAVVTFVRYNVQTNRTQESSTYLAVPPISKPPPKIH